MIEHLRQIQRGFHDLWQIMREEVRMVWRDRPRSRAHFAEIIRTIAAGGRGFGP